MTERLDHVEEAQNHIGWAHEQQEQDGEYEHSVRDNVLIAQAHATLALAEQHRIANVLFIARETHAHLITGLEAMGLDKDDFEVPLGLNNIRKAGL